MNLLPAFTHAPQVDRVYNVDALTLLRAMDSESVDAAITDPPYAEVDRDYGRITESEWMALMQSCVIELRRVLKPRGSAVMVLQPNSEHLGKMRLWLWKFMVWCGEYWNIPQDVYWWNFTQPPTAHAQRDVGLMRPSLKYCIWIGNSDCYRNQSAVLWRASDSTMASRLGDRALQYKPSGYSIRVGRMAETARERGGSTPYNVLPIANANSTTSGGAAGHGAATPYELCEWWVRYISCPGDIVIDPFMGSGTVAMAARANGRRFIGSEKMFKNVELANSRLAAPYTPHMFEVFSEALA